MKRIAVLLLLTSFSFTSFARDVSEAEVSIRKYFKDYSSVSVELGNYLLKDLASETKIKLKILSITPRITIEIDKYPASAKKSILITSLDDIQTKLSQYYGTDWQYRSLSPRLAMSTEIDGYKREIEGASFSDDGSFGFSAAYYSGAIPGLPGLNPKKNRFVTLAVSSDRKLIDIEVYQAWMAGGVVPRKKEMKMEVIEYSPL